MAHIICEVLARFVSNTLYYFDRLLSTFQILRKATVPSRLSVCPADHPSVSPHRTNRFHWTDFHEIWYLNIFRKSIEKIQVSLQSDKNNRYFTWRPIYIFLSYLTEFFLEWVIFQTKFIENQNPNFVLNKVFTKSLRLWDNVERYCIDGRTQITMRLLGMLDT